MTFEEIQTTLEQYESYRKPERKKRAEVGVWAIEANVVWLTRLWNDEGLSALEIARTMGQGLTRNAIIGKARRLHLAERACGHANRERISRSVRNAWADPEHRARMSTVAKEREARRRRSRRPPALPCEPLPETAELFIPIAERKGVHELQDGDCRWPIGDPQHADFHFCGHAKAFGSYCEFHARKAYAPSQHQRPPEAIHWNFPSPVKVARRAA